jgi:hypothetical protein
MDGKSIDEEENELFTRRPLMNLKNFTDLLGSIIPRNRYPMPALLHSLKKHSQVNLNPNQNPLTLTLDHQIPTSNI